MSQILFFGIKIKLIWAVTFWSWKHWDKRMESCWCHYFTPGIPQVSCDILDIREKYLADSGRSNAKVENFKVVWKMVSIHAADIR